MPERIFKELQETKEKKEMLRNKGRNNINSIGCNNSSTFDTSRSKYKPDIR